MKKRNVLCLSAILALTILTLGGCAKENGNDQALGAAVACLDTASSSVQADSCANMVSGQTTTQSYMVRCSANLIAQGLTGARLASAFQQISSTASGSSSTQTATMMAYFVFAQNLPNDTAAITNTNCSQSGVQSLTGLGNLVYAATILANAAAVAAGTSLSGSIYDPTSSSFNAASLKSAAAAIYAANDATTNTQIGTLALSAQTSYCSTGSSLANQSVCTQLNSAVQNGNGNAANTGRSLLNLLQQ